jgi:hypothetical protein
MSIQDAIVNATRDILSSYLAPELVEQLSDDIMHRAAPDIEAALTTFAGFDFGKGLGSRAKNAGVSAVRKGAPRGRRRKDANETETHNDAHDDSHAAMSSDHSSDPAEPSPADMA